MKIAVPSYQVRSGYMPVCWSGTSLFEILDPPLNNPSDAHIKITFVITNHRYFIDDSLFIGNCTVANYCES